MSKNAMDIYLEFSPAETRAARVDEDGLMHEFLIERLGDETLLGNIYIGRIQRIEKGMDAAFVDIGLPQAGLINKARGLQEGQWLPVQVTRQARDGKGPALSRNFALSGRYLGYNSGRKGVNWARNVGKGRDRARLETFLGQINQPVDGLSVRGPAVFADAALLRAELERLVARRTVIQSALKDKKIQLVEAAPSLFDRLLRDAQKDCRFMLDDREIYLRAKKHVAGEMPELKDRLEFYAGRAVLFEEAGLIEQLEDALAREISLAGGGSLVFERTEALQVIDVNMGGGTGYGDDAAFKINRLAAEEICRQITLRNLSGLIVVDFITMKNKGRAKKLVELMRARLARDSRHVDVLGLSAAGLVEITRQREGQALADRMQCYTWPQPRPLPMAQGAALLRAALRLKGAGSPVAYGSPLVIEALKGPLMPAVDDVSRRLGRKLMLRVGDDRQPPQVEMER